MSNYKRTNFSLPLRELQETRIILICMQEENTMQVKGTVLVEALERTKDLVSKGLKIIC